MPNRVTTAEFIKRAKAVHGDRYDYSLAKYQGIHKYVTIVCAEHGPFQQSPANHYQGKGCSDCGGSKPHTTESFIEAAQAVHGERYDYPQVEYSSHKAYITIICADHGPFVQSPTNHLAGKGCPKCGKLVRAEARRKTTEQFIARATAIHGDRYDYSKVLYVAAKNKVTIICPEHGEFEQTPANHCTGYGCHECGGNKPLTLDRFIERANKIHKGRYDYSRVEFKNVESKVEIICPDHGPFLQRLMSHLRGFGCDRCGRVETAKKLGHTLDRFLEDARQAHGDRYDYSQVEYVNALSKVTIICPDHGPFRQLPSAHIRDIGCPKCGAESAALNHKRPILFLLCYH